MKLLCEVESGGEKREEKREGERKPGSRKGTDRFAKHQSFLLSQDEKKQKTPRC